MESREEILVRLCDGSLRLAESGDVFSLIRKLPLVLILTSGVVSSHVAAATKSSAFGITVSVQASACAVIVKRIALEDLTVGAQPVSVNCGRPTPYHLSHLSDASSRAPGEPSVRAEYRIVRAEVRVDEPVLEFLTF